MTTYNCEYCKAKYQYEDFEGRLECAACGAVLVKVNSSPAGLGGGTYGPRGGMGFYIYSGSTTQPYFATPEPESMQGDVV